MSGPPPFQAFLDRHREGVLAFLVAAVGPEEADDCFQETFISALRAYPSLNGDNNLRGWVLTIAQRKAIDMHRARGRRPLPVADPPERAAERREGDPALWKAVAELPAKQRTAVALRFVNDLPYREIGGIMGCSEVAARQNVHAGLEKMREEWD
jgi:RNA polymerase sigma factor (sigma-70 family)